MPKLLFLDASAAAKRYVPESGSNVVNYLFDQHSHDRFAMLTVGLLEVASILVRKQNSGQLSTADFQLAYGRFGIELLRSPAINLTEAVDLLAFQSVPLIERHSINATDSMILTCALDYALVERATGGDVILVSSDRRLIAAAQAEGLLTFNPETQTTTELDTLIGP